MLYMLDTNICIYIIKKKPVQVLNRLRKHDLSDICISSITLSELEYGVKKSQKKAQNKLAVTRFVAPLEIMAYDDRATVQYGAIMATLEKTGKPIGAMDLLISAHARSLNCILVTNNEKEFSRVPDLLIETGCLSIECFSNSPIAIRRERTLYPLLLSLIPPPYQEGGLGFGR